MSSEQLFEKRALPRSAVARLAITAPLIGGSDDRIIMGDNEAALLRREKPGEVEPEDRSGDLVVQLGVVTEDLNRRWYEKNTERHHGRGDYGSAHTFAVKSCACGAPLRVFGT